MTRPYLSPILEELVKEFEYKPGWMSYIQWDQSEDGSGGWTLFIISNTENSIKRGERIRVAHPFLIPAASYNEGSWIDWLHSRCADVEMHELGEFFRIRGERVYAPHHGNGENPYAVWHHGTEEQRAKRAGQD